MARPSNAPRKFEIALRRLVRDHFAAHESADEKTLRLRKDWISFLVNEVLVYLSALAIIIWIIVYSFVVLAHPGWPGEDRQFATSLLGMAASVVFGIVFGRWLKS